MSFKKRSLVLSLLALSACNQSPSEFHYTSAIESDLKNQTISVCAEVEYEKKVPSKQICKVGATDQTGKMQVSLHGVLSDFSYASAKLMDVKFFALVNGKKMDFKLVDTSEVRFFDHYTDGKVFLKL